VRAGYAMPFATRRRSAPGRTANLFVSSANALARAWRLVLTLTLQLFRTWACGDLHFLR